MNVKYAYPLLAVIAMFLLSYVLSEASIGFQYIFGIILPYAALITFLVGFTRKVIGWSRVPVPFRIPTTCGQQKTLPWFKPAVIDNPTSNWAVVARMALEILTFRSLFRNTKMRLEEGDKLTYRLEIWLWLFALAFHYAFLVTILRHLRLFMEPVPLVIQFLEKVDSFFRLEILYDAIQTGLPGVFLSGLVLLAAALFLLARRMFMPQVKYISLAADFFPLFLIIGIAVSGILMRYVTKINVTAAKELAMNLVTFRLKIPEGGIDGVFYVHIFFVSALLAYFPFSKLMHLGGVFLSPTRNLPTDTRARRHVNPWNYPVAVHTYEEYEDDFREKMVDAGLPVVKPLEPKPEEAEAAEEKE
jgi:nitrate reductase gamma subunit